MDEIVQAIKDLEHLFGPTRYPSLKQQWDIVANAALSNQISVKRPKSIGPFIGEDVFLTRGIPEPRTELERKFAEEIY